MTSDTQAWREELAAWPVDHRVSIAFEILDALEAAEAGYELLLANERGKLAAAEGKLAAPTEARGENPA